MTQTPHEGAPTPPTSPLPTPASTEGWQIPGASPPPPMLRDGYIIGSTGARVVAWLVDELLVKIVPGALALFVIDWAELFRTLSDQLRLDEHGRLLPASFAPMVIPITLDLALVYLISVALEFLYFVGFWTSRWQATPGMIGLKLRVVDAQSGATLSLQQASKRWIGLGYPLGLLILVPTLQRAASLAQFALSVFLFASTVTDDRRRGLHDRFAGSQVIRHVSSGGGATALGCIVYGIMLIAVWIAAVAVLTAVAGPAFSEFARRLPRYAP